MPDPHARARNETEFGLKMRRIRSAELNTMGNVGQLAGLQGTEVPGMTTAKEEVRSLLDNLPDDCSLEDVQYHLYVAEKIQRGMQRASEEGALSQEEVEKRIGKWTSR